MMNLIYPSPIKNYQYFAIFALSLFIIFFLTKGFKAIPKYLVISPLSGLIAFPKTTELL